MTDDQFEELLKALTDPTDVWVTAAVAIVSAALGVIGGWVVERRMASRQASAAAQARSDERLAQDESRRLEVIQDAAAWALRMAGMPGSERIDTLSRWSREYGPLLSRMSDLDRDDFISGWYVRLMTALMVEPADGLNYSLAEFQERTRLAIGARKRLKSWAVGAEDASRFHPRHDAEWEATLPDTAGAGT